MEALQIIAGKIGFDWRIAISHTINIGIIFFILVKFALPKIKATINERTEKIKQGLKNKEESEAVLMSAKDESAEIIKKAEKEKKEILAKAADISKSSIDKSQEDANGIIVSARALEANAQKQGYESGVNLLENKIGNILTAITDKAFVGKVTADIESNFIKKVFESEYAKR
jgi:F0F1-type ATP synthase membrane subunit b/b'